MSDTNEYSVALYCGGNLFVPAAVTLSSLEKHSSDGQCYRYHLFFDKLSREQKLVLERFKGVVLHQCGLKTEKELPKQLPKLLPSAKKILWVQAGCLFLKAATPIFEYPLKDAPGATNASLPSKGEEAKYLVLLDSEALRKEENAAKPKALRQLPPHFALDSGLLWGEGAICTLAQLNRSFHTKYTNEKELLEGTLCLCFSPEKRPWEKEKAPFASLWKQECLAASLGSLCPFAEAEAPAEPYMISVVIPCYNAADYLEETLNCIYGQSYQNFEVICCDDESTDNTLALLHSYGEKHPNMTVLSGEKRDAGYQRNRGTAAAKGKYVYYMDSDDLLDANAFEILVQEAERMQADVVCFEGDSFFESKELSSRFGKYESMYGRSHIYPCLMDGRDFYACAKQREEFATQPCMKLTRLSMLRDKGILFSEVKQMNDALHTLKTIIAARRCTVLPLALYHRRVHDGSLVTNQKYYDPSRMIESRSVAWVGICRLAAENRDHAKAHAALMAFARFIRRELNEALAKAGTVPDYSFLNQHYDGADVMIASNEWLGSQDELRSPMSKKLDALREKLKRSRAYPALHKIRKKLPV